MLGDSFAGELRASLQRMCDDAIAFTRPTSVLAESAIEIERLSALSLLDAVLSLPRTSHSPLSRIIVVSGAPRSGTTLAQTVSRQLVDCPAVLGYHYDTQYIRFGNEGAAEARHNVGSRYSLVQELAPDLHEMHPLGADQPEECTPLVRCGGPYVPWIFMAPAPGFLEWLHDSRFVDFYTHVWLRYCDWIAHQLNTSTLVVKSPCHFVCYDDLLGCDDRVELVHVERDPKRRNASLLRMIQLTRAMLDQPSDEASISRELLFVDRVVLRRARAVVATSRRASVVRLGHLEGDLRRALSSSRVRT